MRSLWLDKRPIPVNTGADPILNELGFQDLDEKKSRDPAVGSKSASNRLPDIHGTPGVQYPRAGK